MYGLFRLTQVIDKSETVKFLFIHYQPQDVHPVMKGNTGVLKGAVTALFSPFHQELFAEGAEEIQESVVKHIFQDSHASW